MMDYIKVAEAAKKWNISVRRAQDLCRMGKVPGAVRFGTNWMIPADAEKPKDGRVKEKNTEKPCLVSPRQTPQIMTSNLYSQPGSAQQCIEKLSDNPYAADLFEGWLAFTQGNLTRALDLVLPLLDVETDHYGALNVGSLTMACAIWKNDAALWRTGRARAASAPCTTDLERRMRDFWLRIQDAGILTHFQSLDWHSWAEFNKLPTDYIPVVLFYYAKHMHKMGVLLARGESTYPDLQGLGMLRMYPYMVEPLIAQVQRSGVIVAEICIRMFCADAYINIGMKEVAVHHLDIAISLALPDKLYGILAEFRMLLSSVMDDRLEHFDPEAAKEVKRINKEMVENWAEMSSRSISLELSERQQEIARLAAFGFTNEQIAERLHISQHTVKSTVSMIMNKTGAKKRSEFTFHIF